MWLRPANIVVATSFVSTTPLSWIWNVMVSDRPEDSFVANEAIFSGKWRQEFDDGTPGCTGQGTDVYEWRMAGWGSNINSKLSSVESI